MGTGNMKVFLGLSDCRVVAVCDTYEDRRQRAKGLVDAQYGDTGCKMFADFRELIARKDIDALLGPEERTVSKLLDACTPRKPARRCHRPRRRGKNL